MVAECGRSALAVEGGIAFDVVLADLGLPDIPGDVLVRALLAAAPVRPWVIVMTGCGEPDLSRAKESGANAILLKPLDWETLLARFPRQRDSRK